MILRRSHTLALALALAGTAVPSAAAAGERSAVSAIPVLPAPKDRSAPSPAMGVPGLTVTVKETPRSKYLELTVRRAKGYCLVTSDTTLTLSDSTTSTENEPDGGEMWRLVEADGKTSLERTRFEVATDQAWVKSQDRVELRALVTDHGVTVWGMRDAKGDVIVLAKNGTVGLEALPPPAPGDPMMSAFSSSSCGFAATRIASAVVAKGAAAQLTGDLPAEGEGKSKVIPRFVVDVSTSKLARDPEPILSIRVRRMDPSP